MPPIPLPRQLPTQLLELSPDIQNAYPIILRFEESARTNSDSQTSSTQLMYARILGYLLLHGPSDEARKTVAKEVLSCTTKDALEATGKLYFDHYIRAFKKVKGTTPVQSSHPSRYSFNDVRQLKGQTIEQPPRDHSVAKRRALARDGHRCVVTGRYDDSWVRLKPSLADMAVANGSTVTQCAHIFDASTNEKLGGQGSDKRHCAASVWAVMDRFGYKDLAEDLNGKGVHHLENILTLDMVVHDRFDKLRLWFEPTDELHEYRVVGAHSTYLTGCRTLVKFSTEDPKNLPLPSPEYLKIHGACARIAHMSGASEYIDQILEELEDIKVLSEDGTSAELLAHLLAPSSQEISVY